MSAITKLKNKLKQFNINLDTSKIYSQNVAGKRSSIFYRNEKLTYSKDSSVWKNAYTDLFGKKASAYTVTPIRYESELDIDFYNQHERNEEREWYASEIGYAEFSLISKTTKKKFTVRIG